MNPLKEEYYKMYKEARRLGINEEVARIAAKIYILTLDAPGNSLQSKVYSKLKKEILCKWRELREVIKNTVKKVIGRIKWDR